MFTFSSISKNQFLVFLIFIILLSSFFLFRPNLLKAENTTSAFSRPMDILISPSINRVFILNQLNNQITVFDGKEKKLLPIYPAVATTEY